MPMNKDDDLANRLEPPDPAPGASPYFFVLAAVLLWSTGGVFIKLTTVDSFTVNLGRSLLAGLTVAVYLYFKRALRFDLFSLFSGLFYAATLSTFVYANKHTTAANAIFLQYTAPVYILIAAPIFLKERFRVTDLITVAACIGGMSLFFFDAGIGTAGPDGNISGIVAGLISGCCFGLYFVTLRHPRALKHNPALSVLTGNVFIVVAMLPFVLSDLPSPTTNDLFAIGYLGVVQIGIAYILFTYGVANGVRSLNASIIGFFEPLLNPIWVFLFVGEVPSNWAIAGGFIIISAVALHTVGQHQRTRLSKRPQTL